jgi:YtcA family
MQRQVLTSSTCVALFTLTGCPRTITVAGSYFPAWLVCIVASLVLSSLLHLIFFKAGMDPYLRPKGLTYPAMVLFLTLLFYLLFFR